MNPDYLYPKPGKPCMRQHAEVSTSFREAKQKFLADVTAMVPNLSDDELKGSGNLRNLSIVQPIIKAELQKRRERTVWAVRTTMHEGDFTFEVKNTQNVSWLDEPPLKYIPRDPSEDTTREAFAAAASLVSGYSVEWVGNVGEYLLFLGTKEA